MHPFHPDFLIVIYNKLDLPLRTKVFETFMPDNFELPKANPPYPTSIFPKKAKQIIFKVSYILGYYSN